MTGNGTHARLTYDGYYAGHNENTIKYVYVVIELINTLATICFPTTLIHAIFN